MKHIIRKTSSTPAIIYNEKIYSHKHLKKRIDNLSERLLSKGIKSGDHIAIFLPNCPEFIISFFANWQIGAVSVPLDINSKPEELKKILNNLNANALVTNNSFTLPFKNNIKIINLSKLPDVKLKHAFQNLHRGKVLCQFTSGTTGRPKFIYRTGNSLLKEAKTFSLRIKLNSKDKMLCVLPLPFSYALGTCMLSCFYGGAAFYLENRFNPRKIYKIFKTKKITVFPATPFIYNILSKTAERNTNSLESLRLCISAGAPLKEETFHKFKSLYNIDISQLYGLTEKGAVSINYPFNNKKIDSVGKPLARNKVKISKGEITIDNLRTGDLGEIDKQGYLYIRGRKKDIINIAGFKVTPDEVEKVILSYPKVNEALVIGINYKYGQFIKAIVVSKSKFTSGDLINYCKDKIAWYKVPRVIEFVKELPKTNTGKIMRHILKRTI